MKSLKPYTAQHTSYLHLFCQAPSLSCEHNRSAQVKKQKCLKWIEGILLFIKRVGQVEQICCFSFPTYEQQEKNTLRMVYYNPLYNWLGCPSLTTNNQGAPKINWPRCGLSAKTMGVGLKVQRSSSTQPSRKPLLGPTNGKPLRWKSSRLVVVKKLIYIFMYIDTYLYTYICISVYSYMYICHILHIHCISICMYSAIIYMNYMVMYGVCIYIDTIL